MSNYSREIDAKHGHYPGSCLTLKKNIHSDNAMSKNIIS